MKKIKVFLRLGKNPHPMYYDLINHPPEGVDFKYPEFIKINSNKKSSFLHKLKVKIWFLYIKRRPPAIKLNTGSCDIIHSTNNIMISNRKPWVMDVEHVWSLINFKPSNLKKPYFSKVIKKLSSKYCKVIMPYTQASKLSLIYAGCENLESKMTVLYQAKKVIPGFKKTYNKIPRILWAGRRFWEKGGNTVLQVFDKMDKKLDFIFIMMGPIPEKIKKKYEGKKNIKFLENKMHDDRIWEEFRKADVLLYPTNLDSYGLAMLDAMNHYTPIITSDMFSSPELVEHGKNGFVIKHPMKWHDEKFQIIYSSFEEYMEKIKTFHDEKFVSDIAKNLEILIKNKKLRKNMGLAGRKIVEFGKLSIQKRNEKLREIYEKALKNVEQ